MVNESGKGKGEGKTKNKHGDKIHFCDATYCCIPKVKPTDLVVALAGVDLKASVKNATAEVTAEVGNVYWEIYNDKS